MAIYNKADLIYEDYKWTAYPDDDPRITGKPDSTKFSRHEGWEILYLINKLAELWGLKQKASGRKMERMIRERLPSTTIMQEDVRKWIKDNWDKN